MVLYLWKWSCGAWRINPTFRILKDPRCTTMQWCIVAKLGSYLYKRRVEVMYAGCFDSSRWIQQRRSWGQCSGFLSTKRTKLGRHRTECKNHAKIESNKRSKHDKFLFVSIVALLLLFMNQWIHAFTFQVYAMPFFCFSFLHFFVRNFTILFFQSNLVLCHIRPELSLESLRRNHYPFPHPFVIKTCNDQSPMIVGLIRTSFMKGNFW